MKWTIEHLLQRGQTVFLIHVNLKSPSAALHSPSEYIYIYIYTYHSLEIFSFSGYSIILVIEK
jgi:hypothetical protein